MHVIRISEEKEAMILKESGDIWKSQGEKGKGRTVLVEL